MIFLLIFGIALLFSILGIFQKLAIPDPLFEALIGVAILSIAGFMRRRHSWR
jgi:hypothetical protein